MNRCTECNLVGGCWCETETETVVISSPTTTTLERPASVPAPTVHEALTSLPEIAEMVYALGVSRDISVEWFVSMRTLGMVQYLNHSMQVIRLRFSSTIWPYLTPAERYDTVLHEVAHAQTVGHHHDYVWKAAYRAMGGTGKREADSLPLEIQARISKWEGTCPNGHLIYRGRLTKRSKGMSCGQCSSLFNPNYMFTWKELR